MRTDPVYNFYPGPAMLPREVMAQAREELLDWQGSGISVIEMSHRTPAFQGIVEESMRDLSLLLDIPDHYRILFLQGGATHLMSMVPLNLCKKSDAADYLLTGNWSGRAFREAGRLLDAQVAASAEAARFTTIPDRADWRLSDSAAYLYFCDNETVTGVEFPAPPALPAGHEHTPLVSDMTSNFLSRPVAVEQYGLLFAGAQKNFGPAGLTVVIVREDLIGRAREDTPFLYDFKLQSENNSMFNTPPTFSWYMAGLTFAWIRRQGGVEKMQQRALARSGRLYEYIDNSDFYHNPVDIPCRSRMNVPFTLADDSLDGEFLAQAEAHGLIGLKGHRIVGGMRASLYNGMPDAGVDALLEFMADFAGRH